MAKKNWLALALTPVVALGLVAGMACGGDDDDDTTNGGGDTTPVATQTETGTTGNGDTGSDSEIPAGAPEVDQDNLKFIPTELTVKAGEKVYFKNSETALHTVTIEGDNVSGNMRKGEVFVWEAPTEPGEYKITCDYHPQMKATLTVE